MAVTKCPLCGQILPAAIDSEHLEAKLEKLTSPALKAEKKRLEQEFEDRLVASQEVARQQAEKALRREILESQRAADDKVKESARAMERLQRDFDSRVSKERELARKNAQSENKRELDALRKLVEQLEIEKAAEIERVRKETEKRIEEQIRIRMKTEAQRNETQVEKVQIAREKEKVRYEAELGKLQGQLEALTRKLEKQSGERFGEEGEIDLFESLEDAFPEDRIERIGRGVRGADIVHYVVDDGHREVGRIVYESKNVATWQNVFVDQAKKYRVQYDTQYVMIVTRAFPKKERGISVDRDIPIVEPRFAVSLAEVMRESILEISKLRGSRDGSETKAKKLFEFIISDEFQMRFREVTDAVIKLRELQQKDRNSHELQWERQADIYLQIEKRQREMNTKLRSVIDRSDGEVKPIAFARASS